MVALAAGAVLAGCGGGADDRAETTTGPSKRPVTITAPAAEATLTAKKTSGSLTRALRVRGTAAPGEPITVVAQCQTGQCTADTVAGQKGAWDAPMTLIATPSQPSVTISARYAGQDVSQASVITVTLRASEPRPRPKKTTTTPEKTTTVKPDRTSPTSDTPARAPSVPASTTERPATPAPSADTRLLMVGDSLAEGTEPYLGNLLPDWDVTTNARRGRPLAEGMRVLDETPLGAQPRVLAFSLFTNDDPTNVGALESAVRQTAQRAGSGGCAIWATIVRPPVSGVSYAAANTLLRRLATQLGQVRLVDWAGAVQQHPEWLAGDGVHATPAGYKARAQLYAQQAAACAG